MGGLALGSAFATGAFAQDEEEDGDGPPDGNPSEGEFEDDVDVLNYALTLEHLEAEFYKGAMDNLGAGEIRNSDTLQDFDGPVNDRVVGDDPRPRGRARRDPPGGHRGPRRRPDREAGVRLRRPDERRRRVPRDRASSRTRA